MSIAHVNRKSPLTSLDGNRERERERERGRERQSRSLHAVGCRRIPHGLVNSPMQIVQANNPVRNSLVLGFICRRAANCVARQAAKTKPPGGILRLLPFSSSGSSGRGIAASLSRLLARSTQFNELLNVRRDLSRSQPEVIDGDDAGERSFPRSSPFLGKRVYPRKRGPRGRWDVFGGRRAEEEGGGEGEGGARAISGSPRPPIAESATACADKARLLARRLARSLPSPRQRFISLSY